MKNNKLAFIYGFIAILLWSTVATAFKIALAYLPVSTMLLYSTLSSFFILFITMIIMRKTKDFFNNSKNLIKNSLLLGFINPFLYYLILFGAYNLIPAQEAQPLNYTWPLMLTLLSYIILGEKIESRRFIGISTSFLGVIIISLKGNFTSFQVTNIKGTILALSSSVLWALYWIYNSKDNRESIVKMTSNFLVGLVFILIYFIFTKGQLIFNLKAILACVYIGTFEMGITFLFWSKGLELIDQKEKLVKYSYLGPFISLLFLALIIKEKILLSTIVGLIFIIFGIII